MTFVLQAGMRLVVASHNPGKVWEIKQLLAPFGLDAVSAGDLNLPEPEETETTFSGNARLKALAAAQASGLPALADDSGLEVEALGGAPGIYSARWAGAAKDFAYAMKKVAEEVTARHGWSAPGPRANFICALCLAAPEGTSDMFEGRVDGILVWPPRGGNGFGYDPMFLADGEVETFGQMPPARKHAMSHRARAFEAFKAAKLDGLAATREEDVAADGARQAAGAYEGLAAAAANLSTPAELTTFLANVRADLAARPDHWKARDLAGFLEAVETWTRDNAGMFEGEPRPRLLAKALLAGRKSQ